MEPNSERATTRRNHLLTAAQLASHRPATGTHLVQMHGQGNGVRVHQTYIAAISLVALVLMGVAIAIASSTM
ncbi:hypothetical protein HNR19_002947 [Nocardioides thalensis]|uniref:Uncharacterized protein n=1 Tax=Nocardioides thalensis TaxID=1914755 RepID=A0A853C4P2_9ACTN|nr:hypothetical protein [Nocardioides thalensis]